MRHLYFRSWYLLIKRAAEFKSTAVSFILRDNWSHIGAYLGIRNCEMFLCFGAFVVVVFFSLYCSRFSVVSVVLCFTSLESFTGSYTDRGWAPLRDRLQRQRHTGIKTTANWWGRNVSPAQWGSKSTSHSRPSCYYQSTSSPDKD